MPLDQLIKWKRCNKCSATKPVSEFNKSRGKPRGECKKCHSASVVKWQRDNPEKARAKHKKWRDANPEKIKEHARRTWENTPEEQRQVRYERQKKRYLKREYNMTQDDWDKMYDEQGGVCALCQTPDRTGRHGKLSVDHCHETGRVRGLLCTACNSALGLLGDTPKAMERVLAYLEGKIPP